MILTVQLTEDEVGLLEEAIEALCGKRNPTASEQLQLAQIKDKLHLAPQRIGDNPFVTIAAAHFKAIREGHRLASVRLGLNRATALARDYPFSDKITFINLDGPATPIPVMVDPFLPPNKMVLVVASGVNEIEDVYEEAES